MEGLVNNHTVVQFYVKRAEFDLLSLFTVGAAILYAITPMAVIQQRSLGINKVYTVLNESCVTPSNVTCIDIEASVTEWQGLLVEIITTLVLVLIVLNLTDPAAEQYW